MKMKAITENQTSNMKTKALLKAIFLSENPLGILTPLLVGLLARRNIALIGLSSLLLYALAELANARSRKADLTSAPHIT
jgi:hypothetical protein